MSSRTLCVHRRKPSSVPEQVPVREGDGRLGVLLSCREVQKEGGSRQGNAYLVARTREAVYRSSGHAHPHSPP